MIDNYGRNIDYIRISVTDRCNLRCVYCMPEEGTECLSHGDILSFEEIVRVCNILAKQGISKVKITGGEPLVRKDIDLLIKKIKDIDGITSVTITTNGVLLKEKYTKLVAAGVDAITVSLDSANPEEFIKITRRDYLSQVLDGINTVQKDGRIPLKINSVILKKEESDIIDLIKLAEHYETDIRFIEMMPIGLGKDFEYIDTDTILNIIEKEYGKGTVFNGTRGNGPATYYEFEGLKGKIGFISSISHKFCSSCNRIRMTSDGHIKACLQYSANVNLKEMLRNNVSDEIISHKLEEIIKNKPVGHHFDQKPGNKFDEQRTMAQIGG